MLQNILQFGFPALGLISAVGGYLSKPRRTPLWVAAVAAGLAGLSAYNQSFWAMITFVMIMLWAGIAALPILDFPWRFKTGIVLVAFLFGGLALWPTLAERDLPKMWGDKSPWRVPCPEYIKDNVSFRLVAGLDLRGGLRLTYTVDVSEAIRDRRDRYYDEMRGLLATRYGFHQGERLPTREALEKLTAKVEMTKPRNDASAIVIKFKDPADTSKIDEEFVKRFQGDTQHIRNPADGTVAFRIKTDVESSIRERAVTQAKETINRRVDELGLREASVVVRGEDVIIEVPGEDEKGFQEIRDIIGRTARLEFKILDDDYDYIGKHVRGKPSDVPMPDGVSLDNQENAPVGVGKSNPVHYATILKGENETMTDALGRLKGYLETFDMPNDRELGFGAVTEMDEETYRSREKGWRTYYLHSRADITGDQIRDASATPDQSTGMGNWYVSLTFTDMGGDRFEEITGANIKRRFAIILDNKVQSAPVIQARIAGGHAQITMGASDPQTQLEESRQLELVLRSGALPAPITPSNEQRIGPSLGNDAIDQGMMATAVGAALVLGFMFMYYSRAGLIANCAVIGNLFLQLAILASFGASMTLPGIAGLALTIGMSVDANVLINERIREEVRGGKSPRAAIEAGYEKALSAIVDSNLTTLLAALVLSQYGTGPIKGFAITLMIGMVTNLFTGVFATRLVFDYFVRFKKIKALRLG
ncbi:MAG: protein translocase subunit SecD [Polyangiaceae bacterium]|nr:protein translocase subunit SecD [Polyangiaceae bacterium]